MKLTAKRLPLFVLGGLAAWFASPAGWAQMAAGPGSNLGGATKGSLTPLVPGTSPYGLRGASISGSSFGASDPYGPAMPNPYSYGGYGAYYMPDPYGGYLKGAADVLNAQGQFLIQTQQAYLLREQVTNAMIDTRRRIFDEWRYEQANTPTLEDVREKDAKAQYRRAIGDPPVTEIWSGKSLNDMLTSLKKNSFKDKGVNIPIPEDVLRSINLTDGSGMNPGLFRNDAALSWPLVFRELKPATEVCEYLQTRLKDAYGEAKNGRVVDANKIKEINSSIAKLDGLLRENIGNLPFSQYTDGRRYLNQLRDGVKLLEKSDGNSNILQKYSLAANVKNSNVSDMISYMATQGLVFAPAVKGDETAYRALHQLMIAFATAEK